MCTVTVVSSRSRSAPLDRPLIRIMCNRDEQRTRAPSSPPMIRRAGDRWAVMPIDPPSGGTWIGANDAGIVACLLNANPPCDAGTSRSWTGRRSRGSIVPGLLAASSLTQAHRLADDIRADDFPPFRLLVLASGRHFIGHSDGRSISITDPGPLLTPLLLTSSGLGDHVVGPVREQLFERVFAQERDQLRAQSDFHNHHWLDRRDVSVLMSRESARTVSQTIVDITTTRVKTSHVLLDDALRASQTTARSLLRRSPARFGPPRLTAAVLPS